MRWGSTPTQPGRGGVRAPGRGCGARPGGTRRRVGRVTARLGSARGAFLPRPLLPRAADELRRSAEVLWDALQKPPAARLRACSLRAGVGGHASPPFEPTCRAFVAHGRTAGGACRNRWANSRSWVRLLAMQAESEFLLGRPTVPAVRERALELRAVDRTTFSGSCGRARISPTWTRSRIAGLAPPHQLTMSSARARTSTVTRVPSLGCLCFAPRSSRS